jgi:hypothetical protein
MNDNNGLCLVHIFHDINFMLRDWNCGIFSLHVKLLNWFEPNESSPNFYLFFFPSFVHLKGGITGVKFSPVFGSNMSHV